MPLISIQVQINTGKCEKKKKKDEEEEKDDGKVDGEEKMGQWWRRKQSSWCVETATMEDDLKVYKKKTLLTNIQEFEFLHLYH